MFKSSHGSPSSLQVSSHPFTRQIDIVYVYPSLQQHTSTSNLQKIECDYYSGRVQLSEFLDACHLHLTGRFDHAQNDFIALAEGHRGVEDIWCIDHRGLLTLLLTKQTYQQLGLVGEKASKKSEIYHVQVDLHDRTSSVYTRAKERIRLWDEQRKAQGVPPWSVHIHGSLPSLQAKLRPVKAQARVRTLDNIFIPVLDEKKSEFARARSNHEGQEGDADADEENERIEELFEWVGMACMDSERLKANDRPNPFVAQYEAPEPNRIGSVTHVRWSGFLPPSFVKQVLESVVESIKPASNNLEATSTSPPSSPSFLSITANLHRNAPISYISPRAFGEGVKTEARMGRWDRNVECWSLILKSVLGPAGEGAGGEGEECEWVLACAES